jgi:Pyruvate/2-oxoacid:ferredoxin oxidoreductase delta subunit
MAVRKIVSIDEEKCDGCGLCATACHEGAIQIVDGKARLVSESYCDGLGDCLGECPRGAITIEEREAPNYDQTAVDAHLAQMRASAGDGSPESGPSAAPCVPPAAGGGCPGSAVRTFEASARPSADRAGGQPSTLGQWPVQLMLVPPNAPFLKGADLLVVADCVPFAVGDFHSRYLAGKAVVVGCPKFDDTQHYYEKLKAMFAEARPKSITVVRMQVPCCGGIASTVMKARNEAAPDVRFEIITVGIRGEELSVDEVPPAV